MLDRLHRARGASSQAQEEWRSVACGVSWVHRAHVSPPYVVGVGDPAERFEPGVATMVDDSGGPSTMPRT